MLEQIETYADLLAALQRLTPEQLRQPVQTVEPGETVDETKVVRLDGGFLIGTVGDMEWDRARSVTDNAHHPEHVVIVSDWNPWGEHGSMLCDVGGNPLCEGPQGHDWREAADHAPTQAAPAPS